MPNTLAPARRMPQANTLLITAEKLLRMNRSPQTHRCLAGISPRNVTAPHLDAGIPAPSGLGMLWRCTHQDSLSEHQLIIRTAQSELR